MEGLPVSRPDHQITTADSVRNTRRQGRSDLQCVNQGLSDVMTSAVRVSCSLYKMLLFTYPRDFRLRFESEMVATFSDLVGGEWHVAYKAERGGNELFWSPNAERFLLTDRTVVLYSTTVLWQRLPQFSIREVGRQGRALRF